MFAHSDAAAGGTPALAQRVVPVKMVVAGGFGVGKTTFVSTLSEVEPLTTEASMTSVAAGVDNRGDVGTKTTTTVAMDFGRLTVDETLVCYLFGTPGQDRFGFMWDDLANGALGGIVLVDTRRFDDCFPAVDYFEHRNLPFAVALNAFDGQVAHEPAQVRAALNLSDDTPVVVCDARQTSSAKTVMLALLEVVLARAMAKRGG